MLVLSWMWGQKLETLSVIHQILAILMVTAMTVHLPGLLSKTAIWVSVSLTYSRLVSWAVGCE